jgi:hypothetical protein
MKTKKDLAKELIKNLGIDIVIQCLIEVMDNQIDAPDYDIDSVRNPNDIWKFKVIEGLEHAYESFIDQQKLEESI